MNKALKFCLMAATIFSAFNLTSCSDSDESPAIDETFTVDGVEFNADGNEGYLQFLSTTAYFRGFGYANNSKEMTSDSGETKKYPYVYVNINASDFDISSKSSGTAISLHELTSTCVYAESPDNLHAYLFYGNGRVVVSKIEETEYTIFVTLRFDNTEFKDLKGDTITLNGSFVFSYLK